MPKRIRTARATSVTRVAPSQKVLPENLLKFYIEFSGPMNRGEAYEHLPLLDSAGKPIDLPLTVGFADACEDERNQFYGCSAG